MIQPVASPLPSRAATSSGSDGASPHSATMTEARGGGERDAEVFAEAVADRADHQLHRAVRQQIGGHDDRGGAHGDVEIGGDLRQQRIGRAHHGLSGKAGDRQQHDGAGGAAARFRWSFGQKLTLGGVAGFVPRHRIKTNDNDR